VECEVAREALSARIDGEREPVPSARVDEHVDTCADCRQWLQQVTAQSMRLRVLAADAQLAAVASEATAQRRDRGPRRLDWRRAALLLVGVTQVVIAAAQGVGLNLGLAQNHGMAMSGHLLNESTAWSLALGVVMIVAAIRPAAAAGLAGVLGVFACVLGAYVVIDAMDGAVTAARVLSHVPVVLGAILAVLVWRRSATPGPDQRTAEPEPDIMLPHNASRGRRRGHLWPTDGSAA
jgi:predicted anti-sigma-YlaC factor YlaD